MTIRFTALHACCRPAATYRPGLLQRRFLLTLAIETSCDDTAVAVLETQTLANNTTGAVLHFHKKITSNNTAYHGVHPLASLYSHQENLAGLVDEAIQNLPPKCLPDFVSVTRGPGMRSNLFTGLDTAKGLAAAWQIDLVGVHHMQAHALTPRLVKALENTQQNNAVNTADVSEPGTTPHKIHVQPEFPFLSVLASGGHTLLIHSASLTHHEILASTNDIAVGECLDKAARTVLPSEVLQNARSTMYGAVLEQFAFSETPKDPSAARDVPVLYSLENSSASDYKALYETRYAYLVPRNREEAKKQNLTRYGWAFSQPLSQTSGGLKDKSMEMSFSGLTTAVERVVRFGTDAATGKLNKVERSSDSISIDERRDMAREVMRAAFEHIASRVVLALQQSPTPVDTVVMAGGVAANSFLRYILASTLVNKGYSDIKIVFPPPSLCTDNAAMIAWAGLEMYQAGFKDPRSIRSIRKWPLDKLLTPPKDDRVA